MPVQDSNVRGRWTIAAPEIEVEITSPHEARTVGVEYDTRTTSTNAAHAEEGSAFPVVGDPMRVSVSATWFAEHRTDDLTAVYTDIGKLRKRVPALGRPPLVLLRWSRYGVEGWIVSLRKQWVHGAFDNGLPRALEVSLTVQRAQPIALETTGQEDAEPSTRYVRISSGQTCESLAWDLYGDPLLGVLVRRLNPQIPLSGERSGSVVRLLERDHTDMQQGIAPVAPPLLGYYQGELQALADVRAAGPSSSLTEIELELGL